MLKGLFFVAALLPWGLAAYADTPSSNLTSILVPTAGSTACFSGPSVVSVPAIAQAAGFTTCAINVDFSTSAYATTTDWLDCTSSDSSKIWHLKNNALPCARVFQTTDQGHTVENFQYLSTDSSYTDQEVIVDMAPEGGTLTQVSFNYPNFYVEGVMRKDNDSDSGMGVPSRLADWWSTQDLNGTPYANYVENDYLELGTYDGVNGDAAVHNWGTCFNCLAPVWAQSVGTPVLPSGYSNNDYHKYGYLFTADGATHQYACGFVDDVLVDSCQNIDTTPTEFLLRNNMRLSNLLNGSASNAPHTTNFYIQYVRVFTCASWYLPIGNTSTATNMCNGTTLHDANDANGKELAYWH